MRQPFLLFTAIAFVFFVGCNSQSTSTEAETESSDAKEEEMTEESMKESSEEGSVVYNVDLENSVVNWKGAKKFVGKEHNGTLKFKSGNLTVVNGRLTGVEFVVDMSTIHNEDMAGTEGQTKLEGHLKSPDFFDVEGFPTASFASNVIVPSDEDKYTVGGDLVIKGIANLVGFPATVSIDSTLFAQASLTIDRAKWDVQYGSESFFDLLKDEVIKDQIELNINIVAAP